MACMHEGFTLMVVDGDMIIGAAAWDAKFELNRRVFVAGGKTRLGGDRFLSEPVGTDEKPDRAGSLVAGLRFYAGSLGHTGSPSAFSFSTWTAGRIPGSKSFAESFFPPGSKWNEVAQRFWTMNG